jgi:hypothetical protein
VWPQLAAAACAALLYAPSLTFGLVFDDHSLVSAEGPVYLGGPWLPYRPLRHASLWLDHLVGGGAPWAYHLTNVALHAAASALVVKLAMRAGARGAAALVCALPFVVHPLGVEAVAYVGGRRDLLVAVCGLAALVAWASPSGRTALAIACVVAAAAAKETGLLFVFLLAGASACGIGPPLRRAFAPLAFAGLAAFALPVAYGATGPLAPRGDAATKLVVAGAIARHYSEQIVAPRTLSVEYPHLRCKSAACVRLAGTRSSAGLAILAALAVVTAHALARRFFGASGARRRDASGPAAGAREAPPADWLAFGASWVTVWMLALSMVIGAHEPGADRHAYPLLAGVSVVIAAWLGRAGGRRDASRAARGGRTLGRVALAGALAWSIALAVRADARLPAWRDDLALWTEAVRTSGGSARVHHNVAAALAAGGRERAARRHLRRAVALAPEYWPSALGLAALECRRGRPGAASLHVARAQAAGAPPADVSAAWQGCRDLPRRP